MTASNFAACIDFTLDAEGGFADNPRDPGGATNHGITIATLSAWLGKPATVEDVRDLTEETATEIYRARYWDRVSGDELPAGIDLMVFDFGVNAGPSRSIRRLQQAVNVDDDGIIGPITLGAVRTHFEADADALISEIALLQEQYYRSLSSFRVFGHGWLDRLDRREILSKRMATR